MRFILAFLSVLVYVQLGYVIARMSLTTWLAKDNRSKLAFLLFPVSYRDRSVGDANNGRALLTVFDFEREAFDTDGPRKDFPGRAMYVFLMFLFWPLKFVFNVPMIVVLLTFGGVAKRFGMIRVTSQLGLSHISSVRELYAERRMLVEEQRYLQQAREAIDAEIDRRKRESVEVFEQEDEADEHFLPEAEGKPRQRV